MRPSTPRLSLAAISLFLGASRLAAAAFDVRSFGAVADGATIDSPAIDKAIAAAAAAGGGTVVFPSGTYACYSIHLKSHVALYLDSGAVLLAAEPPKDLSAGYDAPEPNSTWDPYEDFGHSHWHNSLIWGENLEDISITGPGRIYGRGLSRGSGRRDLLPEERASGAKPDLSVPMDPVRAALKPGPFGYPNSKDTLPAGVGNKAIALKNCHNVIFRDFTLQHGGHFAILAMAVDNWTVDNLKIDTNRDGIDFDCCQNVRVSNCTVNSPYDDGICPKSSLGLGYPRPTENITITNCQVSGYDEGTLLNNTRKRSVHYGHGPTGRIKYGTESNGGFRNVTIFNCVFEYSRGLALESVDGGLMEDITITNLAMQDICNTPIYIRLGARQRAPEGTKLGTARRIRIDNVVAHNVAAESGILIEGLPDHPIEDLSLSNIFIDYAGGGTKKQGQRGVPENEKDYPEPYRVGTMPAWGLWARHVKNFALDRVEFRSAQADQRPVLILEDVADARLEQMRLPSAGDAPAIVLSQVDGFALHNSSGLSDLRRGRVASEKFGAAPVAP